MSTPSDLVNRALDAAGADTIIGDIEDGSPESNVALRHYAPVLRQLLRAAPWDMARKQAPLFLLADATGQTANVGTRVPAPWIYEYAYPTDCVRVRFVPLNPQNTGGSAPAGNIALPTTPSTTAGSTPPLNQNRLVPAPYLVTTDDQYPPQLTQGPGGTPWWEIQGISPGARSVILTNVQNAYAVYTCLQLYPSLWDPQFEEAFVAALAERIALPLSKDKKMGMTFRAQNMAIAKERIRSARISDGNEMWATTDHTPDWIRVRSSGAGRGGLLGGSFLGGAYCSWDSYSFSNGSAF